MAKRYYWLKLRETFFDELEIKKLRRIAGGDTFTIIYLKMLLLSINNNGILVHEGIEEDFADELSLVMNEDSENVKLTLAFLQAHNLIESNSDKNYLLTKSAEMVGGESESAAKMRRHRERKTSQCDRIQSHHGHNVTLDIDIDIDKDIRDNILAAPNKKFTPPSVEEVTSYCKERQNGIDPEQFIDYYEARGWDLAKGRKMKDWKAAVRTWERNGNNSSQPYCPPTAETVRIYSNLRT